MPEIIEIDDPDVDIDDGLRLHYKGELYTGEVTEHLGDALVSQETYVAGRPNGPARQWYEDGTLRFEGTHIGGRLKGEFKEWHPHGVLKSRKVMSDNGMSLLEEAHWDEDGRRMIQSDRHPSPR